MFEATFVAGVVTGVILCLVTGVVVTLLTARRLLRTTRVAPAITAAEPGLVYAASASGSQVTMQGTLRLTYEYSPSASAGESRFAAVKSFFERDNDSFLKFPVQNWAVLRGNMLYLYDDDHHTADHRYLVVLDGANVEVFPRTLEKSEYWLPSFPLRLTHSKPLVGDLTELYIFVSVGIQKESWYYALRRACGSEETEKQTRRLVLNYKQWADMMLQELRLVRTDTVVALNMIIWRYFWDTDVNGQLSARMRDIINYKLNRVMERDGKPPLLTNINMGMLHAGKTLPIITSGISSQFNREGDLVFDADITYPGGFRGVIQAEAAVDLLLGGRLALPVELSLEIIRLTGRVKLLFKSPPTDRVWIAFHERPTLDLAIIPLVGDKAIAFSVVKQYIERVIADVIYDNLVLPNMLDFARSSSDGCGDLAVDLAHQERSTPPFSKPPTPIPTSDNNNNNNNNYTPTTSEEENEQVSFAEPSATLLSSDTSAELSNVTPAQSTGERFKTALLLPPAAFSRVAQAFHKVPSVFDKSRDHSQPGNVFSAVNNLVRRGIRRRSISTADTVVVPNELEKDLVPNQLS